MESSPPADPREIPDQLVVALTGADEDELGLLVLGRARSDFSPKTSTSMLCRGALEGVRGGGGGLTRDDRPSDRTVPRGNRRLVGPATDQEPADLPRMGGHRSAEAWPISRRRRRSARLSPRRCAPTSRTSCASSTSTHAPTLSPPPSGCGSPRPTTREPAGPARCRSHLAAREWRYDSWRSVVAISSRRVERRPQESRKARVTTRCWPRP